MRFITAAAIALLLAGCGSNGARQQILPVGNTAHRSTSSASTIGQVNSFLLPVSYPTASLVQKPGGAMWFTQPYGNSIGKIDVAGQVEAMFALPTPNSQPMGLTYGPDGALWFTEAGTAKIGRITVYGVITEYPTAPTSLMNQPQ